MHDDRLELVQELLLGTLQRDDTVQLFDLMRKNFLALDEL